MKWFINIFRIILVVCPGVVLGQTYFNMRYPPDTGTWGSGTRSVEIEGSNYYSNRWSASNSTGFTQYGFCKIDSFGLDLQVMDTLIDTTRYIVFGRILKLNNGTFVDIASVTNYITRDKSYGVFKFDTNGLLSLVYDTSLYSYINLKSSIELPNKDLIFVGDIRELPGDLNLQKVVLIKTDSVGHQLWKKIYRMSTNAWNGESIALCPDGGFIIGGAEVNNNLSPAFIRPLVIKVDSNGNRQWHRLYGSAIHSNQPAYGITTTHDSGYVFVGGVGLPYSWSGTLMSGFSPWVVGLNAGGGVVWADTNSPETPVDYWTNHYSDIETLDDGSFIVTGQVKLWDSSQTVLDKYRIHGVLAKFAKSGDRQWLRKYRHPEVPDESYANHLLYDVDPTPDGGFVAVGWVNPTIDNTQDTWMIKVDSLGCLVAGCEVTGVPKIESSITQLNMYPNPAHDVVHFDITPNLRLGNQQSFNLKLYDLVGRLVLIQTLHPDDNTISVSHLKSGVYNYCVAETWGSIVVE